jgi:hypothetical protein
MAIMSPWSISAKNAENNMYRRAVAIPEGLLSEVFNTSFSSYFLSLSLLLLYLAR